MNKHKKMEKKSIDDKMKVLQAQIGVEKNSAKKHEQQKKLEVLQLTKRIDGIRGQQKKNS